MHKSLLSNNFAVSAALSMIEGHHQFLRRNTGNTLDGFVQHYIFNPQNVNANNRHSTVKTAMEGYANGYGTTEGQALSIIGYATAYLATGSQTYLDWAIAYWQAYVDIFYITHTVPETPQRWKAHWTLNAKEPVLANYPLNPVNPALGGFKAVQLNYANGQTQVPTGSPYWGQYLDKATFAYVGQLSWDSIEGDVVKINPDGSIDWQNSGTKYEVNWVVDYLGRKVGRNPQRVITEVASEPIGTIQLNNTALNGTYKTNFTTRNPVSAGGTMMARNQHWNQWPLMAPLPDAFVTNASDAEQWFAEACDMLYKITKDVKYQKARDSSIYTLMEYTDIDSNDLFFRQSTSATSPFTDGISYAFTYPDGQAITHSRDSNGVIVSTTTAEQLSLEQQTIWFRINSGSSILTSHGGVNINTELRIEVNQQRADDGNKIAYVAFLNPTGSAALVTDHTMMTQFMRESKDNGVPYLLAASNATAKYGTTTITSGLVNNVTITGSGTSYGPLTSNAINATIPDTASGFIMGAWATPTGRMPLTAITYKCDSAGLVIRAVDDLGWRYQCPVINTSNAWVYRNYGPWTPSSYQDKTGTPPANPTFTTVDQIEVVMPTAVTTAHFSFMFLNEIPPQFSGDDGYIIRYRITYTGPLATITAYTGDCVVENYRTDSLAYTPGVVPFSNNYRSDAIQFDSYRGLPYPGYQYPWVYLYSTRSNRQTMLNNMIKFMCDAQDAWETKYGYSGPVMPGYIWDRWDSLRFGPPNTWIASYPGTDLWWPGFQCRAFFSACRCWYEMGSTGLAVPSNLVTYITNWITFLRTFQKENNGRVPATYTDGVAGAADGTFQGDGSGLYLAGACMVAMLGVNIPELREMIEDMITEIQDNYRITGVPNQIMDGAWSPDVDLGGDNGQYFGFWAGEMLRGLSLYVIYKTKGSY